MTADPLDTPRSDLVGSARFPRYEVGRRTVLRVIGEIDMATVPALTGAIDAALAAGALELWIDLTGTSFMDSSGVHTLLAAHFRTRELQRRLAIICPRGPIRRLFDLAGVGGEVPLYDDLTEANRCA